MKLLIVNTSTGWGGLEMNVVKLAGELQLKGVEVHFVCQAGTTFDQQISGEFSTILRVGKVKKYFDFTNAKLLAQYMQKKEISIVFTAFRPDLDLLLWTKRRLKHTKIVHQQQMQIGPPKKGIFQTLRFKSVDLWLTPLHWLKEEVLEKTLIKKDIIRIVPLGVRHQPLVDNSISKLDAQQHFNISTDSFVLGVIGRIDEKKGQLLLTKAVKQLLDAGEDVKLLIVGAPTVDNPKSVVYHKAIISFIEEHKLQSKIHFAPFTKEIHKFYRAIDTFVMSSEGETFGMVTVEAMMSKIPVIGTNSSGTPEVLGHGKRGELYAFNNQQSFVEAYYRLRAKLANGSLDLNAVQKEAIELYSLEKEVAGVLSAFEELKK